MRNEEYKEKDKCIKTFWVLKTKVTALKRVFSVVNSNF